MKLKILQIIANPPDSIIISTTNCTEENLNKPCFLTMTRYKNDCYFLSTIAGQSECPPALLPFGMAYAEQIINTIYNIINPLLEKSILTKPFTGISDEQ